MTGSVALPISGLTVQIEEGDETSLARLYDGKNLIMWVRFNCQSGQFIGRIETVRGKRRLSSTDYRRHSSTLGCAIRDFARTRSSSHRSDAWARERGNPDNWEHD